MAHLRWSPLLVALLAFGSGCPSTPSSKDDGKPAASASAAAPAEVNLPGIDTSALTPRERREWSAQVSELLAPCSDTPVTIAQCVQEKRSCKACVPAAQFLLDKVRAGRSKKEREEAFALRFDPKKVKNIVLEGSPEVGPPDAPVTIVEWADFECPACRAYFPILDGLAKRFPNQVRLVYRFYPLSSHPHGEIAARAGAAALQQGKFWEMHHMMFEHQERLEQADLEGYAKELKLDLPKFRTEMTSEETTHRIEKDKKAAEDLGLTGTPMIYINGRHADLDILDDPVKDLEAWVKLDLEMAGVTPAPPPPKADDAAAPAASGSAAPAAGSAAPAAGSAAPAAGSAKPLAGKK
jgi:predicted DsbA family dithiol-disulfide isomerase